MNVSSLLANEHLFAAVFLHLPLNVVWRLPGWNKLLNQRLMNEHLWKLKVERELRLRHDIIPNYRFYYLMHSTNGYGRLYHDGKLIEKMERVRAISLVAGTIILWIGDKLYHNINSPMVLAHSVTYFHREMYVTNGKSYLLQDSVVDGITSKLLSVRPMIHYYDTGTERCYLFTDGTLEVEQFYDNNDGEKITNRIVMSEVIAFELHAGLRVLFRSGVRKFYHCMRNKLEELKQMEVPNMLKMDISFEYRFDGTVEPMVTERYRSVIIEPRHQPVRSYSRDEIIRIDGKGFRPSKLYRFDELNFDRIIDISQLRDVVWIVGVRSS